MKDTKWSFSSSVMITSVVFLLFLTVVTKGCGFVLCNDRRKMIARANSEKGEYVILVHGLARTRHSMGKVQKFLEQQGYIVLNFNYPSTKHTIPVLSENYLKKFVQTQCPDPTKKIHFVTHSMGGILVRFYLKADKPEHLGRVVMLAPPNQGSEVTDWLKGWFVYKWFFGPAGRQLGTDGGSIPSQLGPVDFELGVIAGDRSINPLNSLRIPGPDDGKVSVERTKVQGMKDFLLVHKTHTFMMRDKTVLTQINHFLQTGMFRRKTDA
jgi:hypothetical protein